MTKTGWICPKCDRVFAPFITECTYCAPKQNAVNDSSQVMEKFAKPINKDCLHQYDALTSLPPKFKCKFCGHEKPWYPEGLTTL